MNNYAVSSDGIATALQDSASALMESGNSLEQSVALIAAANKVLQDPNSVGSALRTISLRLRGTSVEILEEMGEETDGAVESVSKLQKKLKALTGVDILTDSGAYKDTYTILYDIAEVWDKMDKMDQAAALELMAGKNRANALAAILGNIKDLKGAYESALDAEGSAMRENEAYLDSIQGRIDLFNNALQTFWMNLLDTSTIKGVVDAGTVLLKFTDTFVGKLTAIVAAFAIVKRVKDGVKFTEMFESSVNTMKKIYAALQSIISGTKSLTTATIAQSLASNKVSKELVTEILTKSKLAGVDGILTKAQIKLTAETLNEAFANGKLTASQYLATMSTMGLKTALQALGKVLLSNPIYLVAAAVAGAALAFDHFHTTAQEAADAAKEAFDEIQGVVESTKSTIQSLESELSTLQDKIDEFDGKQLSFVEDQELEKLKNQREELEHSLKVQEQLLELQRESSNKQAVASMKAYTKAASEGAKETQDTAKTWGTIAGVISGALLTIGGLALIPVSGGTSSALSAMGVSAIVTSVGAGAAAGGIAGNKAGEAIGSSIAANEGTYDSWYETYAKALDAARKDEQEALEKYQKDSSNIDKLDKWQEAQQRVSDIETEMYDHLSQMQQYMNSIEVGDGETVDAELQAELDAWNNFLDKFSILNEASGAKSTALDRIFGTNASEEIQLLKEQILDTIGSGENFDFDSAINGSQELKRTLDYIGLSAEDVKNYFTQIGEAATASAVQSEKINPIDTYSVIIESVSQYNDILTQTNEILGDNTQITQEYKDAIIELIGSEEEVNDCFDDNNKLVVKNAKKLKDLVSQNIKLKKAQSQLDYHNLVKQLNNTLNGTKQLDAATRDSIYTLLDQIDTVEMAIYQYQLLEDSLLGAVNAFDEFAKAQEVDALNTYGDSYTEMVQIMYDAMYKTGQVGTKAFETAVEFLVPESIYQGIKEEADRMKAIYDYFNGNILPTGRLDEDQFALDYDSLEYFVKDALDAGVFAGDIENFDLVEGMNLEKAAELMGRTETQAYALFAELDKYNTNGSELSFLQQLDDSLEGRITKTTNKMEELNRQKLALLEAGGYEQNKEAIDSINQQLAQCDKNLEAATEEAYNMWQAYSNNDIALNALSAIEDKQQQITKEGAATLGLEWDEVKGKTIQQVYDEILAKQQEIGEPTEISVQFAKEHIEAELDELEKKLEEKEIDIEANVVWDEKDKQYEAAEGSQYANDEDLQRYINLQNEGYALDNYFESGMTVTEEYLSNIQDILQGMYDHQTGKDTDKSQQAEGKTQDDQKVTSGTPMFDIDQFALDAGITTDLALFFSEIVPEMAGDISADIGKFFSETFPQAWDEFWASVGESLNEFGAQIDVLRNTVSKFFTETVPQAWSEFWAGVGEKINEIGTDIEEFGSVVGQFFKETIPQKWEEFWNSVDGFLTQEAPYAVGYAAGVVARFFTVTIPEKWDEFWNNVGEFIDNVVESAEQLSEAVEKFFTETIPEKWDEMWENIGEFYEDVIAPVIDNLRTAIFTFFNETLPRKWDEFWNSVCEFFVTTIPNAVENTKDAISTFFTVTLPAKWNEFWSSIGQFINETVNPAIAALENKLNTFFTETVPAKWNELWDSVDNFFTVTIPGAIELLSNKINEFFTVTVPAKWTSFWSSVDAEFITPIATAVSTIGQGISTFFTVTVPGAINGMWSSITSWIRQKASEIWDNLKAGFTAGFSGGGGVNGTAHSHGTARVRGTANKSGNWGAPKTETSLVGELGPEILVRGNRWTTVGENGAEFTQVKKGDIIFNHKQTEGLLKNGYITGRGNAYASGTAYAGLWNPTSPNDSQSNDPGNDFTDAGNRLFDAADSISGAADSLSDSADEFREVFDWIEVRLEEINEDIDLRSAKLNNAIGSTNQNALIDSMIDLNEKLYENLLAGADRYYSYAQTLLSKVPEAYREAAQNGTIAIEEFVGEVDEETLEAIQEYREWVQKGADATQQAEEVLTEISSLAKQAIDNIANDYENKASIRNNEIDQLDAYNALLETKYGSESSKIYKEIIAETNKNIATLEEQRNKMQAELNEQVNAGNIKKYSQDWYDAVNDIAALDTEIIELTKDTYDYQDAINEIYWDNFDALMDQYEMISNEAENLIDILGTKDVVNELGEWTDEGVASLGLYAQQMENAEMQAKKYREEIDYLNKNWESMGLTQQEYIDKLDELKSGQYDAIKAYNDTKDAIVDLNKERVDAIKNGIEKEIDAYEELIDTKKKALEAEKDAVDFQRSIEESTKEISDIERQIASLSADSSASARAKRAKLEAELLKAQQDLQDKYYDRSIQDQQDALDKELESFQKAKDEEIDGWDKYLENTEQVVSDSLSVVQSNTEKVYETLESIGQEYSLKISDALTSPWKDGEDALQSYSEKFGLTMSSTVDKLQEVADEYKAIMNGIENVGNDVVNQVGTNTSQHQTEDKKEVEKQVKVGGKINAGNAKIYAHAGATSGEKQYYSNDPIYKVLAIDGDWVQVRHHNQSTGVTGWFKKSQVKAYAKGTTGVKRDQLALIDELGDELIMHADGSGKLAFLSKGSSVIPHDISENLMQLGELNPQDILDRNRPVVSAPHVTNNNIELNVEFGEVVHIDHVDNNTVPNLAKTVEKQIDKYMKGLNAEIRKYVR